MFVDLLFVVISIIHYLIVIISIYLFGFSKPHDSSVFVTFTFIINIVLHFKKSDFNQEKVTIIIRIHLQATLIHDFTIKILQTSSFIT